MIQEAPVPVIATTKPPPKIRKTPWQRLWRDPFARGGLIVLAILYLLAIFADPVAPYSMYFNDPILANAPPTNIYVDDPAGPYVFLVKREFDPNTYQQTYVEQTEKKC